MTKRTILISGTSSGFGALTARELAQAGHVVYAGMRETAGRNAKQVDAARAFAAENKVDLRCIELDVVKDESVRQAVDAILNETGGIDVLVHNAGHMTLGPAEAFTPEQCADIYDVNVLGTQRLNRAVLPGMRARRSGLVVWVSSSSARGGVPPLLGPYFAAKAAMDSLAVSYAGELARWGVETCIVVPGVYTSGTNHFAHAALPADQAVAEEYAAGPYKGVAEQCCRELEALIPPGADAKDVARTIAAVVDAPRGARPFRTHMDPANDGCAIVNAMADRMREELLRRIGLADLLQAQK